MGVGVSTFVEPSGGAGFESGTVRVERTGEITVLTGSSCHGQGHETSYAQVIADKMHVSAWIMWRFVMAIRSRSSRALAPSVAAAW